MLRDWQKDTAQHDFRKCWQRITKPNTRLRSVGKRIQPNTRLRSVGKRIQPNTRLRSVGRQVQAVALRARIPQSSTDGWCQLWLGNKAINVVAAQFIAGFGGLR